MFYYDGAGRTVKLTESTSETVLLNSLGMEDCSKNSTERTITGVIRMKHDKAELHNRRIYRGESYRDVLRRREPHSVNTAFSGGAYGCPGEYFRGAAALDCRGEFRVRCALCWSSPYGGEEWIPPERREM